MASRFMQRIADEITDVGYQVFPDLSWVYNKPLHVSGPTKASQYENMRTKVLNSSSVLNVIESIYNESGIPLNKLKREAKSIFDQLSTEIDSSTTRGLAYMFRKFWRSAYDGVYVNMDGLKRVRQAQKKGPIVLIPTHKSYADFIILSYLFYEHNINIPRIIAGANLDFMGVGTLLKKAGAIWIRRSFSSDKLYQAVFEGYIHELLSHDTMLECFIEGGRSRVGKVLSPKIGFLRTLVHILVNDDALWQRDIKLIPISISYDKLMESSAYTSEMLGGNKKTENLSNFLNAANSVTKLKFGSIDIRIGELISLRNKILQRSRVNDVFALRAKIFSNAHFIKNVCLKVAHECLYKMNLLSAVTATSAISTILLTEEKRGISVKSLGQKIEKLIDLVRARHGKVANIFGSDDNDIVVDKALNVMSKLLINRNGIVMVNNDSAYLELAMYRNQLLHHFVSESLIAIAMISFIKETIKKNEIMQRTQFLSHLLKHEFMYKPATSFLDNFDETLDFMIDAQSILSSEWNGDIKINEGQKDIMLFLAMLIWPYIDIYWVISLSLKELLPNKIMSQREFADICSRNASIKYYEGQIDFFECVGVHSINNAMSWFKAQNILTAQSVQINKSTFLTQMRGTTVRVFQLSETYRNETAIDELANVINIYRKPTKDNKEQRTKNNNRSKMPSKL